jgi:RNA polymerase sigma-70 factor, ECF subfamily
VNEASVTDQGSPIGKWGQDLDGFDLFYEQTSRGLIRQLYLMCGDLSEAQDCVQEAYVRAWQRWPVVSGFDRPDAWVRTVALRMAIGRWRRLNATRRAWSRRSLKTVVAGPQPDGVAVLTALGQLQLPQREAVVLHHLCQFTVKEISDLVGVPEGTVKARLSRGRSHLATVLGKEALSD